MPIWDKDCSTTDCEAVNQTYIHELSLILGDVTPALTAPCDAWSEECASLLGPVVKRLESQATVLGRRVKVTADQLDQLGVPDLSPDDSEDAPETPTIAQDASGGTIDHSPVMQVVEAPDTVIVTPDAQGERQTPVDIDQPAAYLFGEQRSAWHQRAAAFWPDLYGWIISFNSAADMFAAGTDRPVGRAAPPDPLPPR